MEAKTKKEPTALEIGYKVVKGIGYTHSQLLKMDCGVNYPTLRRIKSGEKVKKCTEEFYLRLFVNLINKEYERCMQMGGKGATDLLRKMRLMLLAIYDYSK